MGYLWRFESLVKSLREGNIEQREQFKYVTSLFVVYWLLNWAGTSEDIATSSSLNSLNWIFFWVWGAQSLIGIFYLYNVNRSIDDRDFLVRFVCTTLPVTIRSVPVVIFLVLLTPLIYGIFFTVDIENIFLDRDFILTLNLVLTIFEVAYFWYQGSVLKRIQNH